MINMQNLLEILEDDVFFDEDTFTHVEQLFAHACMGKEREASHPVMVVCADVDEGTIQRAFLPSVTNTVLALLREANGLLVVGYQEDVHKCTVPFRGLYHMGTEKVCVPPGMDEGRYRNLMGVVGRSMWHLNAGPRALVGSAEAVRVGKDCKVVVFGIHAGYRRKEVGEITKVAELKAELDIANSLMEKAFSTVITSDGVNTFVNQ